jgi:hypothetical protein
MVQLPPAVTLVPQLFANPNDDASAPVTAMLVMVRGAVPVLVSVTDCDALVDPTFSLPNDRLVADSDTAFGVKPVPLRRILWLGDPVGPALRELSVSTSDSLRGLPAV